MDDVFGESYFVAAFPWRKRTAKSDVPFGVSQDFEWILCYAKSDAFSAGIKGDDRKYFDTPDLPGRSWRVHDLTKQTSASDRPNSFFTIVNPKTGEEYPANSNRTWAITKDTFDKYYNEDRIVFPGDYPFLKLSKPALRYFKDDDIDKLGEKFGYIQFSTLLPKEVGLSQDGTRDFAEIFDDKIFQFPKPVNLIKHIINSINHFDRNSLVLDFFAGSATTAQSVMQLNAEDGGNRKFIMVQIDEPTNPESEARNLGYNTIDEIARDRIKRAAKKIKADRGKFESSLDLGFKHYRLATPDVQTIDKIIEFNPNDEKLLEDDMVAPFANIDTGTSGLETLRTTWLIDGGNSFDTPVEEVVFADYKAHLVQESQTLYLISQGFNIDALKAMLNKIGKREMAAETIVVYSYSFDFVIMRELEIGLNTLDNKPHLIKRY
jgi:hypothetical protein